eukprot:jgi/Mesen1/9220/ME000591S08540
MPHQWHHSMDKNSKMKLHSGWVAKRAGEVEYTGEQLSNDKAPIVIPEGVASSRMQTEEGWLSAVVPGTVLTTLVKNGVYPDPLYGLNNNAIPDIYHAGRDFYTFWFCNTFELPQYAALNPKANQKPCVVLAFRGINYSAEVYFNGTRIELTQPRGMFLRRELDVTDLACLGGANRLAVLVHPPDHPGCVDKGGQGGDHDIAKDVTAEYVEGWDWICPIRDRNTGIWDEVSVHIVGLLFERVELWWPNNMGEAALYQVQISAEIDGFGESDAWSHRFGFRHISHSVDPKTGGRLFQVNGQPLFVRGANWIVSDAMLRLSQERYNAELAFHAGANLNMMRVWGGALAERPHFYDACDRLGLLEFWITGDCNGRGTVPSDPTWPLDHDLFLDCARDTVRMLRNHASLALWVGGNETKPPPDINAALIRDLRLWEAPGDAVASATDADDPSLLLDGARVYVEGSLWNGFGDGKGGWSDGPYEIQEPEWYFREGYYKWGFNPEIGNVGVPESATIRATFPPEFCVASATDADDPSLLLDGARVYVEGSLWNGFGDGKGGWSDGPYEIQEPEWYFREGYYKWGFNPEIGNVGVPESATIRATFPPEFWAAGPGGVRAAATAAAAAPAGGADGAPGRKKLRERSRFHYREVPNVAWDYHTFIPYSQPEKKIRDQLAMYGLPRDLDDFCEKAQVVNFVQYRALLESWGSGMWARYTGMLIWKTQNPWPGLRGQLYDFLLDVGGGLYGVASGAEPVHVQLNLHTRFVEIVNTTGRSYEGASVKAAVINLDGTSPDHSSFDDLSVPDCTCLGASDVYFLLLTLSDISGSQISRNFYWLYAEGGDYTLLDQDFRSEKVPLDITAKVTASGKRQSVSVTLTNNGGQIYGQEAATSDRSVSGEAVDVAEMNQLGFEVVPWQNDADIKDVGHTGGVPFRTRKGSAPLTGRGPARFGEDQNLPGTSGKLSGKVQSSFPQGSVGRVAFFIRLSVVEEEVPSGCPSSAKLPGRSSRAMPAGTRQGPTAKPSISDQLLATSPYVETRILPTSYSDNYFSLVPGESKVVTIRFPTPPEGKAPVLKVKGWNVAERLVAITN